MLTQNHCDSKSKTASVFGGPGCLRPLAFCLFRTNMLLPVVGVDWETFFSRRKYIYCWIFICIYMYIYENTTTYGDRNFQCETTQFILGLIKDVYNQTFSKHGENCECCPVSRSLSNSQSLTLNRVTKTPSARQQCWPESFCKSGKFLRQVHYWLKNFRILCSTKYPDKYAGVQMNWKFSGYS